MLRIISIAFLLLLSHSAEAHDYEVLFPYSLGYDALEAANKLDVKVDVRGMLADGKVESLGTEATTFDRTLITHLRVLSNIPLTPRLFLRTAVSAVTSYRKLEGKEEPRTIREDLWADYRPRAEITFFTNNNLEVFLGLNFRVIPGYEAEITTVDSENKETFGGASMKYPHLGFVKRAGAFKGGFFFQQGTEKARTVEKYNGRDGTTLLQEDRIQDPTTLAIFAKLQVAKMDLYAEFAAVQAGEGGNRTDVGATVDEDYIRLFSN